MKKIIFLFLLFFSNSAFSVVISSKNISVFYVPIFTDYFGWVTSYQTEQLVSDLPQGQQTDVCLDSEESPFYNADLPSLCKIYDSETHSYVVVDCPISDPNKVCTNTRPTLDKPSRLCSDGTEPKLSVVSSGISVHMHTICESMIVELLGSYRYGCDPDENFLGDCNCPNTGYPSSITISYSCDSEEPEPEKGKSQQTAAKTNELLAESNSKLGVIAATNTAITNLLKQIKDALLSLNSSNFGIFGTNADSSDTSNKNDPNSPEFEPSLSNSSISFNDLEPMIYSSFFQCPSDISIDLAGSSHHFSYKPFCDFSEKLRPLVIAAARVSAAWIVIGAL